ncbi:MAG: PAS domain S-box protein [Aquificaceae bacterium]|nr:PAS domain S-box protein [Aquificaceae bacterium]
MRKGGSLIEVEVDVKPIQIYSILEGAIMSFYDISERKKREKIGKKNSIRW